MTDSITPPRELMKQWASEKSYDERDWLYEFHIATGAAQWGADQELIACGNYLKQCAAWEEEDVIEFYNYRRPKPPTLKELKEQALAAAARFYAKGHEDCTEQEVRDDYDALCRALGALPND